MDESSTEYRHSTRRYGKIQYAFDCSQRFLIRGETPEIRMSKSTARTLLVVGIMVTAGCSGVINSDDQPSGETDQLRIVVQNELASTVTITLTLTSQSGQTILNETKTVQSDGGWVVTTLTVSDVETPVTVTARLPDRNYTNELTPIRSTDRGSRLLTIYDDGINIHECNTNVTCWQQHADA